MLTGLEKYRPQGRHHVRSQSFYITGLSVKNLSTVSLGWGSLGKTLDIFIIGLGLIFSLGYESLRFLSLCRNPTGNFLRREVAVAVLSCQLWLWIPMQFFSTTSLWSVCVLILWNFSGLIASFLPALKADASVSESLKGTVSRDWDEVPVV